MIVVLNFRTQLRVMCITSRVVVTEQAEWQQKLIIETGGRRHSAACGWQPRDIRAASPSRRLSQLVSVFESNFVGSVLETS